MSKTSDRPAETRGSQKLLEKLCKDGGVPSIEEIKKALSLAPSVELKVPNWLIRGIPPIYMEWNATLRVPISQAGALVTGLIGLHDSTINFHVFINGLPVPDIFTVVVQNTPPEI